MRKTSNIKKVKHPDYYQPIAKDKREVPTLENERIQGDGIKTELYSEKEVKKLAKVAKVVSSEEIIHKHPNVS